MYRKPTHPEITEDLLKEWTAGTFYSHAESYLLSILRGEYPIEDAREDVLSFVKDQTNED